MTKNKADKERKRAKRKQAERARDRQRKTEDVRAAKLFLEGMDDGSARGVAALWSIPEDVLKASHKPPRLARVAVPAHYAAMKSRLDRSRATWHIQQFIDATHEVAASVGDTLAAMATVCPEDEDEEIETTAMPPELLLMSPAPEKWLERELDARDGALIAWVVFPSSAPLVVALDKARQLALWFIDDDNNWHAASQVHRFLEAAAVIKNPDLQDTDLGRLMALCGVEAGPEGMPASADDPRVVDAVEAIRRSQDHLLRAFFHMADRHEESNETLDYVAAENERIGGLERELAKCERRYAGVEQERDMARAALARERSAAAGQSKGYVTREELSLVDRLASVFA